MPVHEATLSFPYADPAVATAVERAVRLDAGEIEGDRSVASVTRESSPDSDDPGGDGADAAGDSTTVVVTIEADDPSALRAAKRTWCSLVRAAEETALAARSG